MTVNTKTRVVSFFMAMLLAFGVTALDFDNLSFDFENNAKAYIAIAGA